MKVYKVLKSYPDGRYRIALRRDDFIFDPRGHKVVIEFDDETRMDAYIAALHGDGLATVLPL